MQERKGRTRMVKVKLGFQSRGFPWWRRRRGLVDDRQMMTTTMVHHHRFSVELLLFHAFNCSNVK